MIIKTMREARPSAEDVTAAYRAARDEMGRRRARYVDRYVDRNAKHLDRAARELEKKARDVDLASSAKAAKAMSRKVRKEVAERIDPRPRRRGFGPLILSLGIGAAIGYLMGDRHNRERLTGYAQGLGAKARPVVDDVVARVRSVNVRQEVEEAAVQAEVQTLIAGTRDASGLRGAVEGRTVYLRGEAPAEVARELSERIRQLPGVAAVVNLAMSTSPEAQRSASQAPAPTSST